MRIAVTGAGGYIGSRLVPFLKDKKFDVVEISSKSGLNLLEWTSISDIEPCDVIVHLAAKTFVPDSFSNPADFYKTNFNLTLNCLELAKMWGAKVIYMSSYFYGPPQYIPVDEKHPLAPHNPYASTKYFSEELCKAYSRDFNVPVISLRLFNLYGPGQKGSFLIPEVLEKISMTDEITLKDPRPKRDYIFVDDVIDAIFRCVNYSNDELFEIFNLGTGESVSVEDLIKLIQFYSPKKFGISFTNEYRKGEVLDSVASIEKINKAMNWKPLYNIEKGIASLFN